MNSFEFYKQELTVEKAIRNFRFADCQGCPAKDKCDETPDKACEDILKEWAETEEQAAVVMYNKFIDNSHAEDEMIEFFLPMQIPTKTHQSKRYAYVKGKIVSYDTPEIVAIREKFEAALAKYAPEQKITGPVRLVTKWCFGISDHRKHKNGDWKITKPDTDNMIKLFKDCLTKTKYWNDDAQVASDIVEKFWADIPGIYVRVEKL